MNVYIPTGDITDMQGPCAEGFHVPTNDEFNGLINLGTSIGAWSSSNGINFKNYLMMPYSGLYQGGNAVKINDGYSGGYYTSTVGSNVGRAWYLQLLDTEVKTYAHEEGDGCSIRPFKDTPVIPNSSWTKTYSGTGDAGIYHNSTLGLISVYDGTNCITISDKNLGATTVYSSGATLSEDNCGKYYQRGNNYGFPFTGSFSTSSTQVDASDYGPGNYYSSSTFILGTYWDSSNNANLRGGVTGPLKMNELKNAYIGEYIPPYLCFTANTAGSTVKLNKTGSPTAVTLETSTDGSNWSTYTFGNTITLSNIGSKVYWRNSSSTRFSSSTSSFYQFAMTGSIAGSGDVSYLLNKNSTTSASSNCYVNLFRDCSSLTTAPKLPATTLYSNCYQLMFYGCTGLTSLPQLPATTLPDYCYTNMFTGCSNIKLSTSKTGAYQTAYRIPTSGTGTVGTSSLANMFRYTGGTFTGTPSINTTYYTSNTVV